MFSFPLPVYFGEHKEAMLADLWDCGREEGG